MKIDKLPFGSILIEMFSVVFAVLLALGVNEWRNNNSNEELALEADEKITKEIEGNKKKISNILDNHNNILAELDSVISHLRQKRNDITLGQIMFETPSATAWEAAKLTSAVNYLKYDRIEKITSVYSTQKIYNDVSDKIFQELIFFVPEKNREKMIDQLSRQKIYLINLISIEKQLLEEYDSFINQTKL